VTPPKQVEIRDKDGRLVRKRADHASMLVQDVDYSKVKWDTPDKRDMRDPQETGMKILRYVEGHMCLATMAANQLK
jgi:hypothetical protein